MSTIDIVFDGPPDHESGRFVEVEDQNRASIKMGEWVHRDDGYWVLRLTVADGTQACSNCGHESHQWTCQDCGASVMP